MNKIFQHFKTILKHKIIVCNQCIHCGQIIRGLLHDNTKFGFTEFYPSAMYFQGNKSPIEAQKAAEGYSVAWLHHKGHNPHHWEYWIDFDSQGEIIANKIPYKYVIEMICDWIGAGKVYAHGTWTQSDPLDYYYKVRAGRYFHPDTQMLIINLLECIKNYGLKQFHKQAKLLKNQYDD